MSKTCMAPFRNDVRGITLIELMVVVVIVGILAAIAYPSYQRQVQQTRRSDGQAALLRTAQQLERCFTRANSYVTGCDTADDLDPGIASAESWYLVTATTLTNTQFTIVATPQGAQAADACGAMSITHTGNRLPVGNCW